ncbi:MAG TPA: phosphonoacetaldehyde reductase [Oscillospiraceae bacterium]|nr:phosphonoacetaldehyde reductase [Oscillospiraceae bacterium]
MATYYNPVKIHFGVGTLQQLTTIVQTSGVQRLLLLTGARSLKAAGFLDKILAQLQGIEVLLQDSVPSNPDVADIYRLHEATKHFACEAILAVGGGSVIDTAKALAAFKELQLTSVDDVRTAIQQKTYLAAAQANCPVWAVPTTAGTGSEVTPWATIWDQEAGLKYSIADVTIYPQLALVDPVLTQKLSPAMTASSALDALGHALEAYWSKNTNEIVRLYAREAISQIVQHLRPLLHNPTDLHLRSQVAYGSLYAGLAFSNTKTTACHSISYPLTLQYGINHGVAVSLTLGAMLVKNAEALVEKEELFTALHITSPAELNEWIQSIYAQAAIPGRLRDYGISAEDLPALVEQSYTPGRMDNNPVDVDKPALLELLTSIL